MELLFLNGLDPEVPRIFDIKIYDPDLWELMTRFCLSFAVCWSVIKTSYNKGKQDNSFTFTYYVFAILIFFVTNLLDTVEMSTGFALGLFAIFAILRYRTIQIPIREMTYLFVIIAVSVINAISTKKFSWAELITVNSAIIALTYYLELKFSKRPLIEQFIEYEVIENIKPENKEALHKDLSERTGLEIVEVEVDRTDFLRDTARLRVLYRKPD